MPQPGGAGFFAGEKIDTDHDAYVITRRSRTGFIVCAKCTPTLCHSKKQNIVESISYGSEFIDMNDCCECLRGYKHRLHMMGMPCEGISCVYGDNQSMLCKAAEPDSTLKKESQSIAHHLIRQGAARNE